MKKIIFSLVCLMLVTQCTLMKKNDKKTIVYFSRGEPVLLEIWKTVANEFMKKNPDVYIKIENVDYNAYWSKLLTMIAAGTPPDVIFLESNRMTGYIERDALTDLTPFINREKDFKVSDFFDIAIKPYKRSNKLYGLPNDVATTVMFYNKNLFDQAGIKYPDEKWTWDDMLAMARKLTRDQNNDNKTDQFGIAYYPHDLAIAQNGGSRFDNAVDPKKCLMNSKAVREAIQFCHDLGYVYKVAPVTTDFQDTDGRTMFIMGRIAMIPDGHWMVPRFKKEITTFSWDVVVLPKKKYRVGSGRGSCFAIPSGSKYKEEAFRFIKFATGYEGQKILMKAGFSMPALKTIAYSEYFQNKVPENKKAFIDMTLAAQLEPMLQNWSEYMDLESAELDKVWINIEPAAPVLDNLTKQADLLLKK